MVKVGKVERTIAGRVLSIETGKVAKQAAGAVLVRYGDTVVLSTAVSAKPREAVDFFPLTVDYRERTSAAGKFPGGFMKREGRPTNKEILTMRMIDRPLRPLFPKGFLNEVQIQNIVLSADKDNDPDVLSMIGSSAALCLSDIPFEGPLGAVRIGRVNDQFIINPTHTDKENSTLELVLGGHADAVNMIEVSAKELSEEVIADAIEFGHNVVVEVCQMISELTVQCGKPKFEFTPPDTKELVRLLEQKFGEEYCKTREIVSKEERQKKMDEIIELAQQEFSPPDADNPPYALEIFSMAMEEFQEKLVRQCILAGKRSAGRAYDELRPISGEVGLLPRTHGSSLFTRGETQAMVSITLGTSSDAQIVESLHEEFNQNFMLHYYFPPFCVGEVRRIMGPGRREIGHGALAEKSLQNVMPDPVDFPYTIRIISDILESNGSSSMASVCGGTLALMDAGVPIRRPVAGISTGMVSEGDRYVLLTDILGEEDHYGDMDFKVAGTQIGITGVQLDLKARCISFQQIRETFQRAREARMKILKIMLSVIEKPREAISQYAPKLVITQIPTDMIGMIIGPGGREIKALQESTGTTIEIEDDGSVFISCLEGDGHLRAKEIIELMTKPVEVGKIYDAKVVSIKDFGVFAELAPGKEGMCHVSELDTAYIQSTSSFCRVGDVMPFKVVSIDETGRIKLSRKEAIKERDKAQKNSKNN